MPSYINTNMNSMNVQMALNSSQSAQQTAMQRLSTGLKINSAADNAAGFAIATRMSSQIAGDTQAASNANDAISLTQTAGGDLTQISNNLQTMRNLAVQASNATNSSSDRAALNNQLQALSAEIQRVSQTSSFNGVNLLDGTFTSQNFQVGANANTDNRIQISAIASASTTAMGSTGTTTAANIAGTVALQGLLAGDVTLNGIQVGASAAGALPGQSSASASSIAAAINNTTANSGVTATATATEATGAAPTAFTSILANQFSVNGIAVGAVAAGTDVKGQGANVAAAINLVSAQSGVTASASATTGVVTLTAADGRNINIAAMNTTTDTTPGVGYTGVKLLAQTGFAQTLTDTVTGATPVTTGVATLTVNGVSVSGLTGTTVLATAQNFVTAFNNAAALTANATTLAGITATTDTLGVVTLSNNGTQKQMSLSTASAGFTAAQDVIFASQKGSVSLSSSNVNGLVISGASVASAGLTAGTTAAATVSNVNSVANINISTAAGAVSAISVIDGALAQVTASQAALGAVQNRFTSAVTSLQTTATNLTASRSRIQDTDYAATTAELSRTQILQQAGNAMLAQANQLPNQVMTLLR